MDVLLSDLLTLTLAAAVPLAVQVSAETPVIVLVHGAFEDASVWQQVQRHLEKEGYQSTAVNLPGRGGDQTPKAEITMDVLRDAVVKVIKSQEQPVVLVGHSFGGMVISAVAEAVPERIRKLIYVAAYLPKSGESLQSLAMQDRDSKMGPHFQVNPAAMVATVGYESRADLFLNDGAPEQRRGFADTMVDEPLLPPGTPVTLSPERFGTVAKAYVRTAQDQVV